MSENNEQKTEPAKIIVETSPPKKEEEKHLESEYKRLFELEKNVSKSQKENYENLKKEFDEYKNKFNQSTIDNVGKTIHEEIEIKSKYKELFSNDNQSNLKPLEMKKKIVEKYLPFDIDSNPSNEEITARYKASLDIIKKEKELNRENETKKQVVQNKTFTEKSNEFFGL